MPVSFLGGLTLTGTAVKHGWTTSAKRKGIPQAELLKKVRSTFSKLLSNLSREEGEDLLSLLERETL